MKDIRVTGSGVGASFQGLPEMNLSNVSLEDAVLQAETGIIAVDTDGLILKRVKVIPGQGSALTLYNSKNVEVRDLSYETKEASPIRILGKLSGNIELDRDLETDSELGKEVLQGSVTFQ